MTDGGEDALEKGMATHSSILAWGIPWTEKPGGLHEVVELDKNEQLTVSYLCECLNANRTCVCFFISPERRSPNSQRLTLPEAAAVLLAFLQKPQEGISIVNSFNCRTEKL